MRQWELERIQDHLVDTMPDLCDIYRNTGNEDEYGGGSEYARVIDDLPCGVAPTDFFQFQQTEVADQRADIVYYSVALPVGTAVRQGDVIDIFTQGTKVTAMQIERGESWDTMVRVYGQVIDDSGWFDLNLHSGGHS